MSENELEATPVETAQPAQAVEPDPAANEATRPPKKGSIPNWLAVLIILALIGGVYFAYDKLTADKIHRLPNKKASNE